MVTQLPRLGGQSDLHPLLSASDLSIKTNWCVRDELKSPDSLEPQNDFKSIQAQNDFDSLQP